MGKGRAMKKSKEGKHIKLLILTLICLLLATSLPTQGYGAEDEPFSATLVDFGGEAFLQKPGEAIWLPVEKNIPLEQSDRIKTGSNSYVEILIDDGSLLKLEENSEMTMSELSADFGTKKIATKLFLFFGRLVSNIAKFTHTRSRFAVQTPTVIAGVRGTEFIVETTDSTQTDVGVFEGEVTVGAIDKEGKLIEGSEVRVQRGNQTSVQRNKRPLTPFAIKGRMLLHKKGLDGLRKRAVDRRRNLKKIIGERGKARGKILKRWEKIRQEKRGGIKRPDGRKTRGNGEKIKRSERRKTEGKKRKIKRSQRRKTEEKGQKRSGGSSHKRRKNRR